MDNNQFLDTKHQKLVEDFCDQLKVDAEITFNWMTRPREPEIFESIELSNQEKREPILTSLRQRVSRFVQRTSRRTVQQEEASPSPNIQRRPLLIEYDGYKVEVIEEGVSNVQEGEPD